MSDSTEEVLLRLPARAEYGRIVRVGAASLAMRQGLSFSEIDDLRLAIDEAVILILGAAVTDAELSATFRFDEGGLELELACDPGGELQPTSVERFARATDALIDGYEVDAPRAWLQMRKSPG